MLYLSPDYKFAGSSAGAGGLCPSGWWVKARQAGGLCPLVKNITDPHDTREKHNPSWQSGKKYPGRKRNVLVTIICFIFFLT